MASKDNVMVHLTGFHRIPVHEFLALPEYLGMPPLLHIPCVLAICTSKGNARVFRSGQPPTQKWRYQMKAAHLVLGNGCEVQDVLCVVSQNNGRGLR